MIRDDASPEELDRWFRRTSDEIERGRRRQWTADWNALRTPEHLARKTDTLAGGAGDDTLAGSSRRDRILAAAGPRVAPRRRIEAYETGPDGKLQFTPEYARHAEENHRRLMKAQDDLNYGTGFEGVPGIFNKSTGPAGAIATVVGLLTSTLSRYAQPPPKRK